MTEIMKFRKEIRKAIADYMASEGCSCCRNNEQHEVNSKTLGKLLCVTRYKDGSGYDFMKYRSSINKA